MIRDFSDMTPEQLEAFNRALYARAKKAEQKALRIPQNRSHFPQVIHGARQDD